MNTEDIKPNFGKIERTLASQPVGTWSFNQAGVTFNELGLVFGGADNTTDIGPSISFVSDTKPNNYDILDL